MLSLKLQHVSNYLSALVAKAQAQQKQDTSRKTQSNLTPEALLEHQLRTTTKREKQFHLEYSVNKSRLAKLEEDPEYQANLQIQNLTLDTAIKDSHVKISHLKNQQKKMRKLDFKELDLGP